MPTIPCFPPPLRAPGGWVTVDGKRVPIEVDERTWGVWFRTIFDYIVNEDQATLADLSGVSLTAAQKADLTDGGDSALHFHQSDRNYADAQDAAHVAALDPHPVYLTQPEGNALYDPLGAAATRTPMSGFPVDSAGNFLITLSYNETTRTVTITPTGATFDIFVNGVKFTKTGAQSIVHSAAQGNHFVYYDATGTLVESATVWDLHVTAPVLFVFWDAANSRGIPMRETHQSTVEPQNHEHLHFALGTEYRSGFTISGYVLTTAGDANTTYAVSSGTMSDEGLLTTVDALADAGPYAILERVGADGHWEFTRTAVIPFLRSGTDLQYNQNNAGTWQRTNVGNNNFTNYYVLGVPALPSASITPAPGTTEGIVVVTGQAVYATLGQANAEVISSISWGDMPFQEFVPLYRILMGQFAAAGGTQQIIQVDRIVGSRASVTLASTTDHGTLSGLLDDDHTQYFNVSRVVTSPVLALIMAGS